MVCRILSCKLNEKVLVTNKTNIFIKKAKEIHNNKYDYSAVKYINSYTKVKIICPKHGEFEQRPNGHLKGNGCRKCKNNYQYTTKEFIEKANHTHNNKYDYSKTEYINSNSKIIIICPKHGEFEQIAFVHLQGSNCPRCVDRYQHTTKEFIEKAKEIHNNKYDYSKTEYINSRIKVKIICPKHGEFEQIPSNHLRGCGCNKCVKYDNERFINTIPSSHVVLYNYSKVDYINDFTKVKIICPKHGEFEQTPSNHKQAHGCPKCTYSVSTGHMEVEEFIKTLYDGKIHINNRSIIYPKELDIYIEKYKFAIEYHGLYYHSYCNLETKEEKEQHYLKHKCCININIKLFQIFESEWRDPIKNEILKSKIRNEFGLTNRTYARKCQVKSLENNKFKEFINNNHMQGYKTASIKYGLFYDDELLSVMSFNKHPKYEWEINRFANKLNHTIVGGASKLFKHFVRVINPNRVLTYADARYSSGNLYRKLGFKFDKVTKPNYCYTKNKKIFSRQQFMKCKLKDKLENFDPALTEAENMFNSGYRRLWDAGNYRFLWERVLLEERKKQFKTI